MKPTQEKFQNLTEKQKDLGLTHIVMFHIGYNDVFEIDNKVENLRKALKKGWNPDDEYRFIINGWYITAKRK